MKGWQLEIRDEASEKQVVCWSSCQGPSVLREKGKKRATLPAGENGAISTFTKQWTRR
jgi:hypothetical protein